MNHIDYSLTTQVEYTEDSRRPSDENTIRDRPVLWRGVLAEAGKVILRDIRHLLLDSEERVQFAPPVQARGVALGEAEAQGYRSLVEHKVYVLDLAPAGGDVTRSVRGNGPGGQDDLDVEMRPERGEVGHGKVVGSGVPIGRERLGELPQAEGGEDRDDVGIVCKVKVDALVERERFGAAVERHVDLRARVAERVVLQTSNDLLLIADTDGTLRHFWSERKQ